MREIKFRAWDGRHIAEVIGIKFSADLTPHSVLTVISPNMVYESIAEIKLMQFTNLLDKNDKEVFESDILKDNYGTTYIVEWEEEQTPGFHLTPIDEPKVQIEEYKLWRDSDRIEVIGNIYENPELIKESL